MKIRFTILILVLCSYNLFAQTDDIKKAYRIEGSNVILYLDHDWPKQDQERLLEQAGMKGLSLDTLWTLNSLGKFTKEGWKIHRYVKNRVKIYKPINQLSGDLKWNHDVVMLDDKWSMIQSQTSAIFGYNEFKKTTVITKPKGVTQFFLRENLNANDVFLSGTFNNWSTLHNEMVKTDSGWVLNVNLQPGKHCYKFIVDGHWITDPENLHRENDYHGGFNSVYFVTNSLFNLNGFEQAKEVVLSGSFNQWNKKEARLKKTRTGWELPVYLKDGSYEYKFIVDKNWINDPAKSTVNQNKNSVLQIGESHDFILKGFLLAKEVYLAGNFNNWNPSGIKMTRTATGWQVPYILSAGNYQYKFVVDGEWILDPQNPHTGEDGSHKNSLVSIKPNHTFIFKGSWTTDDVYVAGNFNGWKGYAMKKTDEGWKIDVYLPTGKCLYKFIVNGKWIIDPANILWEQNEFHNGNSVLWIGPQ